MGSACGWVKGRDLERRRVVVHAMIGLDGLEDCHNVPRCSSQHCWHLELSTATVVNATWNLVLIVIQILVLTFQEVSDLILLLRALRRYRPEVLPSNIDELHRFQ